MAIERVPEQKSNARLPRHFIEKGKRMSKGNNRRGNKETKKPKQVKPKVLATANSNSGKSPIVVAGKKLK